MKSLWWSSGVALLFFLLVGCREEEPTERAKVELPAQNVTVAEVQLAPVTDQIEVLGTVAAKVRAEISTRVSGTISSMPVQLGTEVQRGDLLLAISAGEIDARLRRAQAELQQARRNLDREKKLLAKKAATTETVKSLEESLTIAEAAYEEARTMQGYTQITAPFDGRVTRKMANRGDLATPGKPLLDIEDETQLQVLAEIPEAMIIHVRQGDQLPVRLPSANLTVTGTVAEVAPTANPATRSGPIKLDIEPHADLRSGQFARVVLSRKNTDTLTVSEKALVVQGQMEQMFVVDGNVARLRLVRTGSRYGETIEVLSGLTRGERVVVEGQSRLQDGQPVVVQ
jgi:RND family efflux transporter MFP subunit